MLATAKNGIVDGSGTSWALVAIAQSELGNMGAARAALASMAEVSPVWNRDPAAFLHRHQASERVVNAVVSGLEKAGWRPPPDD